MTSTAGDGYGQDPYGQDPYGQGTPYGQDPLRPGTATGGDGYEQDGLTGGTATPGAASATAEPQDGYDWGGFGVAPTWGRAAYVEAWGCADGGPRR